MEAEDRAVFNSAKISFDNYSDNATKSVVVKALSAIEQLDGEYKEFVESRLNEHMQELVAAIVKNAKLCKIISSAYTINMEPGQPSTTPTHLEDEKVMSVLRQIAREWSSDGRKERAVAFGRIIYALDQHFPNKEERSQVRIVVPGCGLGRLPFELSLLGFNAVGNEFSAHMLLASHAILNTGLGQHQLAIHPYIHSRSHWRKKEDQLRSVEIPDVSFDMPQPGEMAMGVGDFFDMAFSESAAGAFQAVATSFFIDAPFDFFRTLDAISCVTAPGGLWVNFGPLHWHSEMSGLAVDNSTGLELSLEDVISAIEMKGWKFLERESAIQTTYCSTNPNRMGRMLFDCEFWVARKEFV